MSIIICNEVKKICIELFVSCLDHLSSSSRCQDNFMPAFIMRSETFEMMRRWLKWPFLTIMFQVSQLADCCRGPSSPRAPRLASSSTKTSLRRPQGLLQNQFIPMTKRDTENVTLVTVRALRYNAAKLPHFYNAWPRSQVTDECEPCFAFCWIWEARRLLGAFIIPDFLHWKIHNWQVQFKAQIP